MAERTTSTNKKRSLAEMYQEAKKLGRPKSAAQEFVEELMSVTDCNERAVRGWLAGDSIPTKPAMKLIAQHFRVDAETLFPNIRNEENN